MNGDIDQWSPKALCRLCTVRNRRSDSREKSLFMPLLARSYIGIRDHSPYAWGLFGAGLVFSVLVVLSVVLCWITKIGILLHGRRRYTCHQKCSYVCMEFVCLSCDNIRESRIFVGLSFALLVSLVYFGLISPRGTNQFVHLCCEKTGFLRTEWSEFDQKVVKSVFPDLLRLEGTSCDDMEIFDTCLKLPKYQPACNARLGCEQRVDPAEALVCSGERVIWPSEAGWLNGPTTGDCRCHLPRLLVAQDMEQKFNFLGNERIPVQRMFLSFGDSMHLTYPERRLSKNLTRQMSGTGELVQCHLIAGSDDCYHSSEYDPQQRPFYKAVQERKLYDFVIFYDVSGVDDPHDYLPAIFQEFLSQVLIPNDRVNVVTYYSSDLADTLDSSNFRFLGDGNVDKMVSFVRNRDSTGGSNPISDVGHLLSLGHADIFVAQETPIGNDCFVVLFLKNDFEHWTDSQTGCTLLSIVFRTGHPREPLACAQSHSSGGDCLVVDVNRPLTAGVLDEIVQNLRSILVPKFVSPVPLDAGFWVYPYPDMFDDRQVMTRGVYHRLSLSRGTVDVVVGVDIAYSPLKENFCPQNEDLFRDCEVGSNKFFIIMSLLPIVAMIPFAGLVCSGGQDIVSWMEDCDCLPGDTANCCFDFLDVAWENSILVLSGFAVLQIVFVIYVFDFWVIGLLGVFGLLFAYAFLFCLAKPLMVNETAENLSRWESQIGESDRHSLHTDGPEQTCDVFVDMAIRPSPTDVGGVLGDYFITVGRGEMIAIVGHSGAGKSTLFRVLMGTQTGNFRTRIGVRYSSSDQPVSETAMFPLNPDGSDGVTFDDLGKYRGYDKGSVPEIQNLFSYVQQENEFPESLRVAELLTYISKYYNVPLGHFKYLLHALDMSEAWKKFPSKLSGGEKRRFMLMKEILKRRPLALLDEATSGLDGASTVEVLRELRSIAKAWKIGIVVVIHQPSDAALGMFDRIYMVLKVSEKRAKRIDRGMDLPHGAAGNTRDFFEALITRRRREFDGGVENDVWVGFFDEKRKTNVAVCQELRGDSVAAAELDEMLMFKADRRDMFRSEEEGGGVVERPLELVDWKQHADSVSHEMGGCCHIWSRLSLEELRNSKQLLTQLLVTIFCAIFVVFVFNAVHPFEGVSEDYFERCILRECGDLRNTGANCTSVDVMYQCGLAIHNPMFFILLIVVMGVGLIAMISGTYLFSDTEKNYLVEEFRSGTSPICFVLAKFMIRIPRNICIVLTYLSLVYYSIYFRGLFFVHFLILGLCFSIVFSLGIVLSLVFPNSHATMYGIILVLIMNLYSGVFITKRKLMHWSTISLAYWVCSAIRYCAYSYYGFKLMYLSEMSTYQERYPESILGTFLDLGYYRSTDYEFDNVTIVVDGIMLVIMFGGSFILAFGAFVARFNRNCGNRLRFFNLERLVLICSDRCKRSWRQRVDEWDHQPGDAAGILDGDPLESESPVPDAFSVQPQSPSAVLEQTVSGSSQSEVSTGQTNDFEPQFRHTQRRGAFVRRQGRRSGSRNSSRRGGAAGGEHEGVSRARRRRRLPRGRSQTTRKHPEHEDAIRVSLAKSVSFSSNSSRSCVSFNVEVVKIPHPSDSSAQKKYRVQFEDSTGRLRIVRCGVMGGKTRLLRSPPFKFDLGDGETPIVPSFQFLFHSDDGLGTVRKGTFRIRLLPKFQGRSSFVVFEWPNNDESSQ